MKNEGVAMTDTAGGLAGWLIEAGRWWKLRGKQQQRRKARRRMFILETIVLGPKQRLVLLRCGDERFLVGTGPEGIQTIVPTLGSRIADVMPLLQAQEHTWD